MRWMAVLLIVVCFTVFSGQRHIQAKSPSWQAGEHPRLLLTAAEKSAAVAKLTTPGTASATIWSAFLTSNFKDNNRSYADGAFLYYITGNVAAGQEAVNTGQAWINSVPDGIDPDGSSFNESWYNYEDLLLIYDFAYNLLTPTQKTQWLQYIALQTNKCNAAGPGYAPGNINTLWMFCEYAGAEELEGENLTTNITDEPVFRSSSSPLADKLRYPVNDSNFTISNSPGSGTADYTEGVDYIYRYVPGCGSRCIDWSPSGPGTKEPSLASTYYVSYTSIADPVSWKSDARTALENHLNYQWHDGYYAGGLNPYGNLTTEQIVEMFEMIKRDTGIDYSQNPDVKKIVDMYMYSELPSPGTGVGVPRRFNTINDTNDWTAGYADAWTYPNPGFYQYKSWLRPFVAWATTEYANDPEGYGQRYVWLWTQAYRNANGSIQYNPVPDWREALWINNSTITPYVNTTSVPPAPWPNQRYFRGRELIVAKTNNWNQANINASYFSLVSGNHNYQNEHDQGDSGSFTFFSLDEDWGIDPGYGGYSLVDHNSVGIDGSGYQAAGAYGVQYTTPSFGGSTHFGNVALADGASVAGVDLANAWTLTTTPYVQRDLRYAALVNGSEQPYVVVADDIQKDNSNHSYNWYLHTGIGNTVSISGSTATVTGVRTGAKLKVYSLGPESSTMTSGSINDGNLGAHQRITDTASSTIQARFLHLLVPTAAGQTAPTVVRTVVTNGIQATMTWSDGAVDTVLWRTSGSTITSTNGLTSDGRLTILRVMAGVVTGLTLQEGRQVTYNSASLVSAGDGTAPMAVSAFGSTASLSAPDTSLVQMQLPYVTAVTLEDGGATVPIKNDGTTVYVDGGQPLSVLRRNNGLLYSQDYNDNYPHDLYRFNLSHPPAENYTAATGALELLSSNYEWPSFSKRDSTVWRRTGLFPTMIPSDQYSNGDFSFRFKFNGALGTDADFKAYFRTTDITPADWFINQNYVRLDFNAVQGGVVKNQVTLGQRVNGAWTNVDDNDVLTASLSPASAVLNDNAWHTVKLHLLNNQAQVTVDGTTVITGTLPTAIPTAPATGYTEWKVIGSAPVLLDDVSVTSIDQTPPAAPTVGNLTIHLDGSGQASVEYGHGLSTDAQTLRLYESLSPIVPSTDPSTLTLISSTGTNETLTFSGNANRAAFHALGVADPAGNVSQLLPVTIDVSPPAAVSDLQTQ